MALRGRTNPSGRSRWTEEPLSDEIVARNRRRFAELIGRYAPYPSDRYGFDDAKLSRYASKTNDRRS